MYNVDFGQLANNLIPPNKRGVKHKAWLRAILKPLDTVHAAFFEVYRPDVVARSKHNGQKIIMEDVLNSTFGVVAPPFIYIDNTGDDSRPNVFFNEREGFPPTFFFNESELETPTYFVNRTETFQNTNFVVHVPIAVYTSFGEGRIKSEIDRLRPYSTKYTIQTF